MGNHDLNKPNFIFSSDIPKKVKSIVNSYFQSKHPKESIIDFTNETIEVTVNVELNTLLLRNSGIKPSDLMKENLIFLAKSKTSTPSPKPFGPLVFQYSSNLPPNLHHIYKFASEEVFIVSLTLKLIDFIINLDNLNDHRIDFLKDENYGLLVLCDLQLVEQLETYITGKFVVELTEHLPQVAGNIHSDKLRGAEVEEDIKPKFKEVGQNGDFLQEHIQKDSLVNFDKEISPHEGHNNSTLRDFNQIKPKFDKELSLEGLKPTDRADDPLTSFVNMKRDSSQMSLGAEASFSKSYVFDNGEEYDSSLEELVLLRSNETSRSAGDNDDLFEERVRRPSQYKKRHETFIGDMNNLRHNEEEITIDDIQDPIDTSTNTLDDDILETAQQLTLGSPVALQRTSSVATSPMKSLSRKLSTLLSRKPSASFAMINFEDSNDDLEFAFKATSPLVPSYIKKDKKFKFIKVGKVQKFVNLFEEKVDSANPSRTNTRPPSPIKRD